jgi:hypothetical protein
MMKILRVVFGLGIAAIGFVAALVMLMAFFLFFPTDDTLAARLGSVLILALIDGVIFVVTFYAFRKVMGPKTRNQDGGGGEGAGASLNMGANGTAGR